MTAQTKSKQHLPQYGDELTGRELQILKGYAEGLESSAVAKRLDISVDSVKGHASRMYTKLGALNRWHAVAIGFTTGLLGKPEAAIEPEPEPVVGLPVSLEPKPMPLPLPAPLPGPTKTQVPPSVAALTMEIPVALFLALLGVAAGVKSGKSLPALLAPASRALDGARPYVRDRLDPTRRAA